ncbi:MAG: LigA protein [Micrococcaceae bacterium]|nr:LigA protein [Micrococcaceae bacterium]
MGERIPIIYVRGFAGGQKAIESAVDDPFYGFNEGSSHIRVGINGLPRFYQFEGNLLRLIREHSYELVVGGSQQQVLLDAAPGSLQPDCVWIYRFYDESSGTFGREPKPYDIEQAAAGLAAFIALVREKTAGNPRVNLVAHSMGGLICRSVLQKQLAEPETVVSKLCTMGTPHGGIDVELGGNVGDWILETFGPQGSDIFTRPRMQEYLLPAAAAEQARAEENWDPRRMVGTFPPRRALSIVGTNARDYDVAGGWSTRAMGVQSDGLVAIRNAYVFGSPRAYVHRSHSGRYGLVNSEEAYQNLRRFFFGGLRVELGLSGIDFRGEDDRVWQAETSLAIRGLPVAMHEQRADHYCPIDLNAEARAQPTPMSPVPLVTTYLLARPDGKPSRYALHLKVLSLEERGGVFGLFDHLEQIADWEDSLIVDVAMGNDSSVQELRYSWNTEIPRRIAEVSELEHLLQWEQQNDGIWQAPIPLTPAGKNLLGADAALLASVSVWD